MRLAALARRCEVAAGLAMGTTDKSTIPVPQGLTWEGYCEALGIEPSSARQASLLGCLAKRLALQQAALDAALLDSQNSTRKP